MSPIELDKNEVMKLLISEALRDRRLDSEDKQKISALAFALGVAKDEVELQIREIASSISPGPPNAGFDKLGLFISAGDLALADGVLTKSEERLLFSLKEVLGISDDRYQKEMLKLGERSSGRAGSAMEVVSEDVIDSESVAPQTVISAVLQNIERVIVGKEQVIRLILTAALANSHILLEDVPGTGKTMLARALAASIDCNCKRVQFTPDLLPMDITGSMIYNPHSTSFSFKKGPIFTNIFLADEINRATPRTQSSLLEVMEERQVSIDGGIYPMSRVFLVLATQNPIEQHGTYPLPEAQLDRFLFKLPVGYPGLNDELDMLQRNLREAPIANLRPVVKMVEFAAVQAQVRQKVIVTTEIMSYILEIISELRNHPDLTLGPSPRASLGLMRAGMAYAFLSNRDFVIPDDIKFLSSFVLAHRILLKPQAMIKKVRTDEIVENVCERVRVPTLKK